MPQAPTSAAVAPALDRALDQNQSVKEAVQKSADELLVIHAVLQQEIPGHAQTREIAQALQKTDDLEEKISASVEELTEVNQLLAQEIAERRQLERKLEAALEAIDDTTPTAPFPAPAVSPAKTRPG